MYFYIIEKSLSEGLSEQSLLYSQIKMLLNRILQYCSDTVLNHCVATLDRNVN